MKTGQAVYYQGKAYTVFSIRPPIAGIINGKEILRVAITDLALDKLTVESTEGKGDNKAITL